MERKMTEKRTAEDERASFATYEAIAATLQTYIESARTGDGALMRTAFLDTAHIRGSYAGKPTDWSLEEFCDLIDKHGPATDIVARIVAVEHSGTAASARIEAANWRGTRYTDFLLLLKQGSGWRIAGKVFFAHSRA
jgi:hypothetical protein